eukprot:640531-Amphidinium_carterae.1
MAATCSDNALTTLNHIQAFSNGQDKTVRSRLVLLLLKSQLHGLVEHQVDNTSLKLSKDQIQNRPYL